MDSHSSLNNKRFLVTGGTGFIGRSLVRSLITQGACVRVLDDNSRGQAQALSDIIDRIDFIEGDVRDPLTIEKACKGIQSVCHLAYVNGTEYFYKKPDLVLDVGIKGMINIIDQVIAQGIPELLLMSTSEVYQTPPQIPTDETVPLSVPDVLNPRYSYGGGKIISELIAVNYGRKYLDRVLIVRPHNVYGAQMGWEHVIPQFISRLHSLVEANPGRKEYLFPIQGKGTETRSFIHIDDFTKGVITILEKGAHLNIYNVGTMEEIPIAEVALAIADSLGFNLVIQPGELLSGSTPRRCPDITKLKSLGFNPSIPFIEGIKGVSSWYWNNIDKPQK